MNARRMPKKANRMTSSHHRERKGYVDLRLPCYADGGYGTIRGHFKVSLRATNNTDVDVAILNNKTEWVYPVDFRLERR